MMNLLRLLGGRTASAPVARERLQILLAHERGLRVTSLKRKIAESEQCIAAHERRTKRPVATDLQSLASVSWSSWNARGVGRR